MFIPDQEKTVKEIWHLIVMCYIVFKVLIELVFVKAKQSYVV